MRSSVGTVKGVYELANDTFRITRAIARPLKTVITRSDCSSMESTAPRDFSRCARQAIVTTIEASTTGAPLNGLMSTGADLLEPYHQAAAPRIVTSQMTRAREPLNIELAASDPRPKSAAPPAIQES